MILHRAFVEINKAIICEPHFSWNRRVKVQLWKSIRIKLLAISLRYLPDLLKIQYKKRSLMTLLLINNSSEEFNAVSSTGFCFQTDVIHFIFFRYFNFIKWQNLCDDNFVVFRVRNIVSTNRIWEERKKDVERCFYGKIHFRVFLVS